MSETDLKSELPWRITHLSTNRGPTVKPDEAAVLRLLLQQARDGHVFTTNEARSERGLEALVDGDVTMRITPQVVAIDIGLFERLIHTAEK